MSKKAWRLRLKALRAADGAAQAQAARRAAAALEASGARTAGGFWPLGSEPDVRPLLAAWAAAAPGRRIALPYADGCGGLSYRLWRPGEATAPDGAGIPSGKGASVRPDFVLTPCLGFSEGCRRLGYGGGYFDRWLASFAAQGGARPILCGIASEACLVPDELFEAHDMPMDLVATERRLLRRPVGG